MGNKSRIAVGIDLGTTNSLVAYIKDGSPAIIPNERGNRMTPSVVTFKENGQVIVGEMAKSQAVLNSERTISNVKLSMGRNVEYLIGGRHRSPVEISGFILKTLRDYASRYIEHEIEDVVITVPAYFDDRQREDTLKAARSAGLNVLKLLNEPTAAALTYGFSKREGGRLLVLDLGGGTFDITLMEYTNNVFRVRGVGGSTSIGGTNFDKAIVEHVLEAFQSLYGLDLREDRIAYQQLVIQAEKAKIDLSSADETRIMIPYITATEKGPIHLNMSLTRSELEQLIGAILREIEEHIRQTFEQTDVSPEWVDSVVLVGGSTRLPVIERLVKDIIAPSSDNGSDGLIDRSEPLIIDQALRREINPDEAVALGAGILAGMFEGSIPDIEFHDITSHDLGIEDDHGRFIAVLPRGATYPTRASHLFTTTRDFQEEVWIHVLQEVGTGRKSQVSLGMFRLKIGNPREKGEPNIDVTFAIDANGMLNVSAVDLDSGEAEEITIESDFTLRVS